MKNTGTRNFQLGLFVIISTIVLIVAVYLIGQKSDIFSSTFMVKVKFGNVNGLQVGNNVRLSGINVGSVLSVEIQNDSTVEVTMRIREEVRSHIKQNAIATIGTDGLMGNMLINISPGKGDSQVVKDGDLLQTYSRIKTDDILKTLTTTNENAALLTSDLLEMVQDVRQGKGTVSYLLYDTSLRQEVFQTTRNLRIATEKTNELLSEFGRMSNEVDQGRGLAGWIFNDTITQQQVKSTVDQLLFASQKIQTAADSINELIRNLSSDQGILPALMNDSIMLNDLRQILINLNEGSGKFNEDMKALQKHFLFRKYFKDKEKDK
ncbi:MAG TPA: MlaD family protein [Cyclobacteriaceae bacterium]